jgi:hypothetical protein
MCSLRQCICVTAIFATISCAGSVHAQIAIGSRWVAAPCVHVEWNGSQIHVCAPFVNLTVDLPGCCGCRDYCCQPIEARAGGQFKLGEQLPESPTKHDLAIAANDLRKSLASFRTDEVWQHYLSLAPEEALSDEKLSGAHISHTADANAELVAALRHFDKANQDRDCRAVVTLPTFQKMHVLLANYLVPHDTGPSIVANVRLIDIISVATVSPNLSGMAIDTARTLRIQAAHPTITATVRRGLGPPSGE